MSTPDPADWCRPGMPLSPRQADVHRLLRHGMTNKQIARELGLAVGTVKVHVRGVLIKLGARNRTEAAVRWGA